MIVEFKDKAYGVLKAPLLSSGVQSLQVNVGYSCNMACRHCHVNGGPDRIEMMEKETVNQVLSLLTTHGIRTLDITGGAPELNPHFSYFVASAKEAGCHVIVRSNLTIFFEQGFEHLPDFYNEHGIEITASLPYYLDSSVDRVRGAGAFGKSIRALHQLNLLGYGDGSGMKRLNLVYNPAGTFLAPDQKNLEQEYRKALAADHDISFDHLYVFSNMPIGRFRDHLERTGSLDKYLKMLEDAFNPSTLDSLMCRHLVSVGWDGTLYDCDFNQVLGLRMRDPGSQHIRDFDLERITGREIRIGDHCYGCTAGQGST